jgi:quercetin dioxygenase-like cupin family protein
MKITSLDKVEKTIPDMEGAQGIHKQVPISKDDGSPAFSFRVFTIEPDGHSPYRQHPFEHMNYIIEGHGALVTESGEECEIKKGDFAMVLPNEKHQYENVSANGSFVMICAVPKEYE